MMTKIDKRTICLPPLPFRFEGDIAYVPTPTPGIEAIIDAADAHLVDAHRWRVRPQGKLIYIHTRTLYRGKKRTVLLHQMIMGGSTRERQIDHINGNPLDNRRCNLRFATPLQNSWNTRKREGLLSKYKGVTLHKKTGKWQSQIKLAGTSIYLGLYETEALAHEVYAAVAREFHGEFVRLG